MSTAVRQCEQITRDEGLAAGLAAALGGTDVTATAPGRFAAVPVWDLPEGATVRPHSVAALEDITFLQCPGRRSPADHTLVETGRLLAAVRLGLVRRLLDLAVDHLSERTSGGEPLIRKQMVIGTVADVMAEIELLREYTLAPAEPAAVDELHRQLDRLGWQVTTLFGAAGYICDHPARALYVSALVANTWIQREGASR